MMLALLSVFLILFHAELSLSSPSDDKFVRWFDDQLIDVIDTPKKLTVTGRIPDCLIGGSLLRAGITAGHTSNRNYTNFIDFFGRVTKWGFESPSSVSFLSTVLKSKLYNASNSLEDIPTHITSEKTTPPAKGFPDINLMDNTNVFMYAFEDKKDVLLTFTDFYESNELHLPSLRTLGNTEFADSESSIWSSSHPVEYFDKKTNEVVLVNWIGTKSIKDIGHMKLSVYKMGSNLFRSVVGSVEVPFLPYSIHSVAVAGDYAIIQTGPVELNFMETGVNDCISCSITDKLATDPTRVYVFNLLSEDAEAEPIAYFEINPPDNFFSFHQINAVLQSNNIIDLDLCIYKSMDGVLGEHVLGNLNDISNQTARDTMTQNCDAIRRLRLDIDKIEFSYSDLAVVDDKGNSYNVELVSINHNYNNKQYCYAYAPVFHYDGSSRYEDMAMVKINLCLADSNSAGISTVVGSWRDTDVYIGEPIFVPAGDGVEEDDGYVLFMARDNSVKDVSRLVVVDAKTMTEVAAVEAPFPIPFEFHGAFFPYIS